jgi:hypothetical protein
MSFDGVDDYIECDTLATSMQGLDKFSISFWASGSSYSTNPAAFVLSDGGLTSEAFLIYPYDSTGGDGIRVYYNGATTIDENSATRLGWNHFVYVASSATDHKAYANGEVVDTDTTSKTLDGQLDEASIGGTDYFTGQYFAGKLDEVAVWDTAITPAQISLLSTGSARADSFTPPEIISTGSWVSGKLNDYSLQFGNGPTGANARHTDSVEIPYTSSMEFTTQDFSIGCWVKVHATQTYQGIVSNDISSGGYKGWLLGTVAAGQFTFSTRHPSYSPNVVYTYSAIQSNVDTEWHHVVGVRDGIYNRLYVNGTASATPTTMTSIADNGSIPYRLGQWWNNNDTLSGQCDLDEVGLWNVALDPGAIDELYNSGDGVLSNTVSSSNMVAYYNMESGPGSGTLVDRTGNGNNGTLTNMNNGTITTGSLLMYYDFEIGDSNPVSGNFPPNATVYDVVTASFHGPTAHTGTMTNMSVADFGAWGQGKLGKYSFLCDGIDDSISIASSSYLPRGDGDESFSISLWANNTAALNSYETLVGRHETNAAGKAFTTGYNLGYDGNGSDNLTLFIGEWDSAASHASCDWDGATDTTFRHLVVTYNKDTDVSQLWLNGVKGTDGAKSAVSPLPGLVDTRIGRLGTSAGYVWPGNIDEVAFYNVALDSGAISDLYNSGQGAKANTVSSSALVCYLDMECNGPGSLIAKDLSGNDLSGTLDAAAGTCGTG